ncbi:MAG: hypothetical protein R2751_09335 [Bacteroidales bacterium]
MLPVKFHEPKVNKPFGKGNTREMFYKDVLNPPFLLEKFHLGFPGHLPQAFGRRGEKLEIVELLQLLILELLPVDF